MNKKSVFRFLLTCLFLTLVLVVTLPTTSASAAPSCTGTGCNGKDSYTMRCAGSGASYGVVATRNIYDEYTHQNLGYVQLWWSYTCKTNWARVVLWTPDLIQLQVVSGDKNYWVEKYNTTDAHSPMVYAPTTKAQACNDFTLDLPYVCTDWK